LPSIERGPLPIRREACARIARSVRSIPVRFAFACLALTLCAAAAQAASRKGPAPKPGVAKPETVYVAAPTPSPRQERPPEPVRETVRDPEPRRAETAPGSPLRNYAQAFGGYGGYYIAELLGNNPYGSLFWEFYPSEQTFFFQCDVGIGPVQSGFSHDVLRGSFNFDHNLLFALDAMGGYSFSGMPAGAGRGGGLFPYFLAGISAFWQGGFPVFQKSTPNVGGVVGFGNRMRIPYFGLGKQWAVNYVVRDYIYSQKLAGVPSITQSFALLIGVQKYW
jgi:hypothetical protein